MILSAGALNSPQILLLSGIGPKETLDKFNIPTVQDLPGVGQNLQNHVGVKINFNLAKELNKKELTWASAMDYMLSREGPMSGTGMSQVGNMTMFTKRFETKTLYYLNNNWTNLNIICT